MHWMFLFLRVVQLSVAVSGQGLGFANESGADQE